MIMHSALTRKHKTESILGRYALAICLCAMLAMPTFFGCGKPGLELIPITGVVTLDGKPVQGAAVVFQFQGSGPPARGVTDQNGQFQLTTKKANDGVVAGLHTVTVLGYLDTPISSSDSPPDSDPEADPNQPRQGIWFVPERYSFPQTSQLTANVSTEIIHFEFPLTTEPQE